MGLCPIYIQSKMNKQIQKHEEEYYHIPKGKLRYIFISLLFLVLLIGSIYVTYQSWIFLNLGSLECSEEFCNYEVYQLLIIPLLILDYLIVSLFICSVVSIFKKLNSFNETGLIVGLIFGLIGGLIVGLIIGLIVGLIIGLISGLVGGLICGLIGGLVAGLIYGLIIELVGGFIEEY